LKPKICAKNMAHSLPLTGYLRQFQRAQFMGLLEETVPENLHLCVLSAAYRIQARANTACLELTAKARKFLMLAGA
jgi:hypothetical protein